MGVWRVSLCASLHRRQCVVERTGLDAGHVLETQDQTSSDSASKHSPKDHPSDSVKETKRVHRISGRNLTHKTGAKTTYQTYQRGGVQFAFTRGLRLASLGLLQVNNEPPLDMANTNYYTR
jgi:hypothetical protein